jgi:nucleobase:cation symporter-1, NCS1 family
MQSISADEAFVFDEELRESEAYSVDLAPTNTSKRTWRTRDFIFLWISLAACIPTYQLASGLIQQGMDWRQSLFTITVANLIILIPILLNSHAGTKYGIPFPIYCRAAFGVLGANVPAMLRALVGCGWFGIQCWIGGWAIYKILTVFIPNWETQPAIAYLGINAPQLLCLLLFWSINMAVITYGIESIRVLLNIKAPLLLILGAIFLAWAVYAAKGFGPLLSRPSDFVAEGSKSGQFWSFFFPALTANIGFWATLSLNIPDFSRYAKSQREQMIGQSIGLPLGMMAFSFIGIAVTSATIIIYGKSIWDPVVVLSKFNNPIVLVVSLVAICIATLATNIAANVVSPANDFVHLMPKRISFKTGGWITGVLGLLIQPWNLIADPHGYFFTWLIAYSSVLGAVCGILITDYYFIRRTRLVLNDLYRMNGQYWYSNGFNVYALIALLCGILPCIPGFSEQLRSATVFPTFWSDIYHYSWFVSFAISSIVYFLAMSLLGLKPKR